MSGLTAADDDALDEAVTQVCIADTMDDVDPYDASKALLSLVADRGDAAQRAEAVELIAQHTDYNKSVAEEWLSEEKEEAALGNMEVHEIEKIVPFDPEGDYRYEIRLTVDGQEVNMKMDSSDLMTSQTFCKRLLEKTDVLIEVEEWRDRLNEMLRAGEIETRQAEPIDIEHDVALAVLENIGQAAATDDMDEFRSQKSLVHVDRQTVLVRSEMINRVAEGRNAEVSRRKLRSILDPYLSDNSKKIRKGDDFITVWQFDAEKLDETVVVDMEMLREDAAYSED